MLSLSDWESPSKCVCVFWIDLQVVSESTGIQTELIVVSSILTLCRYRVSIESHGVESISVFRHGSIMIDIDWHIFCGKMLSMLSEYSGTIVDVVILLSMILQIVFVPT